MAHMLGTRLAGLMCLIVNVTRSLLSRHNGLVATSILRVILVAMRLLNTKTLELVSKPDDDIPQYAILSHTWGPEEVSLQDMQGFGGKLLSAAGRVKLFKTRKGLEKVIDAAKLASSNGYQWIWIDTCCIDKTSSAELSEAINSMYKWYEDSEVCYVYLEDVRVPSDGIAHTTREFFLDSRLSQSRWATRGWTLQELIAPRQVHFHSGDWTLIGKKSDRSFQYALSRVTGIEIGIFSGQTTVAEVSVANRMKWASERQTTRPEDAAYCLMGIFAVNMPLLYGEGGQRAFIRLQEEILKTTDDQSIFAWNLPSQSRDNRTMFGLLASSPTYFDRALSMRPMSTEYQVASSVPWTMTNKGLQVQLYLRPVGDNAEEEEYLAILDCCLDDNDFMGADHQGLSPSIQLRRLAGDQYTRIDPGECEWVPGALNGDGGRYESFFVKQNPGLVLPRLAVSDTLRFQQPSKAWRFRRVFPSAQWSEDNGTFHFNHSRLRGIQAIFRFGLLQTTPQPLISGEANLEHMDIVIALQQSARGELEITYYPSASEGDLEQVYYKLNRIWSAGLNTPEHSEKDNWIETSRCYQKGMRFVFVELAKTVRAGRGLYVLDIREKGYGELEGTTMRFELHGDSLEGEALERARAAVQANAKTILPGSAPSEELENEELEILFRPMDPLKYSNRHDLRNVLRVKAIWMDIDSSINETELELCQAVIHEDLREIEKIFSRTDLANREAPFVQSTSAETVPADQGLQSAKTTFGGLRAIHFATLANNPDIMSVLIQNGLDPLMKTKEGHNALQLASILGNSGVIQVILRTAPPATTKSEFEPVYAQALSRYGLYFGSEIATGDTALHLAAMCCSGEEFESIVAEILRATSDPNSDWNNSPPGDLERKYLFNLQNNGGETVLHRAIESGNLEVVESICRQMPTAATCVDGLNRSSVWHTAHKGDTDMLKAIMAAYSNCPNPPYLHFSDDNGITPLHVACWCGHMSFVQELLECGGILYAKTPVSGLMPMEIARRNGQEDVAELLQGITTEGAVNYKTMSLTHRYAAFCCPSTI